MHLVTGHVKRVTAHSVVSEDDAEHPADVLILATGFDAIHFLASLDVTGRTGESLRDAWDNDNARAYLGRAIPGSPTSSQCMGRTFSPATAAA